MAGDGTYTVNPGDTLAKIAAVHGASVATLMQANGIQNPDLISTGQRLIIPRISAAAASSAPVAAVNPSTATAPVAASVTAPISAVSAAPVAALVEAPAGVAPSDAPSAQSAAAAAEPSPAGGIYIVKSGDTLAKIAAATGTTVAALMQANGIKNSNLVYTGQRLVIPGVGAPAKPAAAAGPASAPAVAAPAGGTGLVVSMSKQRCYLFQGGSVTDTWPCSTGRPGSGTAIGNFKIQSKLPRAYGSRWGFWMPYWLGIYWAGGSENGIHGLPIHAKTGYKDWGNKIGTPISFGCIVLQDAAAKKIYDMAYIGMPVSIRR